jgi:hypothetical protein
MASDILIALLRHAEKNLKEALAERFSVMENVPLRLILQFVNDDIDVAEPILKYSQALNDLDLLYIIQSRDAPFWQAIATREGLGENVIEALIDTKDAMTAEALIDNSSIALGEGVIRTIYSYVSEGIRKRIEQNFGVLAVELEEQTDSVIGEFAAVPQFDFMPTAAMTKAADLFLAQGRLSKTLLMNTLKRGQISSFIAQFSRYVGLPVAVIVPMLQQSNGQGLAIACRAAGIERNDFLLMFTFTRKIKGQGYTTAGEVSSALAYYDRVTPDIAKRLMSQNRH